MQISVASTGAGNGKGEADHFLALERSNYLAANLVSHDEHPKRHKLGVGEVPNFLLQRDTGSHVGEPVTLADANRSRWCSRHFGSSGCFAGCDRDSKSAMVPCRRGRPE